MGLQVGQEEDVKGSRFESQFKKKKKEKKENVSHNKGLIPTYETNKKQTDH